MHKDLNRGIRTRCRQCRKTLKPEVKDCGACGCQLDRVPPLRERAAAANGRITWIEIIGDAAVGTNLEGTIQRWNRGAERLFGYSASEAIGKHITLLCPAEDRASHSPNEFDNPEKLEQFESVRVRKDGTRVDVSVVLLPVKDKSGDLRGISLIYRSTSPENRISVDSANDRKTAPPHRPAKHGNSAAAATATAGIGKQLSVLLATASAAGTIAAVRHLGASGLNVGVVSSVPLSAAAWSSRAARSYSAPPESEIEGFVDRLLAIGAANPGQILLPTSDETAWLYTLNAARLQQHFRLYQPSIESMRRILDKQLFAAAVAKAGLSVLPSWEPRSLAEVEALSPSLPYPVLIKPRTHVHRLMNDKGAVAQSKSELIDKYRRYLDREQLRAADNPLLPDASLPILQQLVSVQKEGVVSITGFIDRTGDLFVTRRSTKVFQRSHPIGVGVCFESLPESAALSSAVRRLCRELDYFGIFEVEFLRFDQGWAAIDFNPRLFNQVGMDIRRGMPLPLFACLDAAGETAALRQAVAKAQVQDSEAVFCDGFTLRAILLARSLTGRISSEENQYWRNWMKRHAAHTVDSVADRSDPMPRAVRALSEVYLGLKAFPRFLRSMPRIPAVMTPQFNPTKVKL